MNFSASEHYIEAHTLHLDNQWGACGQCEHLKKEGCQYYYGKCPQGDE